MSDNSVELEPSENIIAEDGSIKEIIKLTDWKNPPTVTQLKKNVSDAEPDFNNHVNDVRKWLDLRDGKLKIKIPKGQSRISPKVVRKQNEWRYSALSEALLSSEDMFDVEPKTYEDKEGAVANAIIINKQFAQDINRVKLIDKYVRTSVDEGLAFLRVGWEFQEEEVTQEENIVEMLPPPEIQEQLVQAQQAVQMGQMDPMQLQQMLTQAQSQLKPVVTGKEMVTEFETTANWPTIEVCDYDKVMIDPTADGDLDKARFIVYQFNSSKSQLKMDSKYRNIDAITIDIDENELSSARSDEGKSTFEFGDDPRKEFPIIEYWGDWDIDGDGTTVPIVAAYAGGVMIRLEENPFPDRKPPFVMVSYLPKRRAIYPGEPDAVLIEDNQDVIGAVSRGMIDLMGKSANAQQGISADALDPAQKLRFESGKDYIFNPGIDPEKAFFMGKYPEIPQSAMLMIEMQQNDAESLTGIKSFTGGISGQALGATATGIRSALDATSKRELGIMRRLADGLVKCGEKIIAMNAVNLDDEEVIRHTNDEYVAISRDVLSGKYDLQLSISTPEKDNEKAQDLSFMLQTIGNGMDPTLQQIILSDIARLKDMPVLAKKLIDFEPKPDPAQVKIQELEIALLEAQVMNEQAKGKENLADEANKFSQVDLNKAKTETERAKTRSLHSSSDSEDLKFLQEKDGTKHIQDMESEDQKFNNEIEKKGVDSLLSVDTPNRVAQKPGSQRGMENDAVLGMDTPQENMRDDKNVRV